MSHGPFQGEPLCLIGDRLGFGEQPHDDPEGFVHAGTLRERFDAQHVGVGHQRAGPHAQHDAPAGDVVQLDHAVGDHERVVVGEADDAGAQLDVAGALGGGGDEEFGRGDSFPAGAVVLADPGFVVAQVIQPLEGFEVALEAEGGVFAEPVEGGQEDSELHAWGQWHSGAPLAGSGLAGVGRNDTAGAGRRRQLVGDAQFDRRLQSASSRSTGGGSKRFCDTLNTSIQTRVHTLGYFDSVGG